MSRGDGAAELLVLEPGERGHGHEWLLHLAAGAARRDPALRLAFAVAPRVAAALRRDLRPDSEGGPAIVVLSPRETALCTHRNLAVSGLARWWVMRRHLRATGARQGLFLELDHLSLPLALGLPFGAGRSVSGILFRPSVHYASEARARPAERLRDLRKTLLYRRMLRHAALARVHTLDDAFPAFARARYRAGAKVEALPDPAFPAIVPGAADRALADGVPPDRVLMVLFGVLTERKGVVALLEALARLDADTAGRVAVILAGEVDPPIRGAVDAALTGLAASRPGLWIRLEARYLGAGELAALVDRAGVVLAPYQRFVGSSGVLMWAAGRGRAVIAQDYGLVGRLVREHGLGLAVDTTDAAALARTIASAVACGARGLAQPARMAAFAAARTPEAFADRLLDPPRRVAGPVTE